MINALTIDNKDNVGVTIYKISKGDKLTFRFNGEEMTLTALDDMPSFHKFAIKDIKDQEPVVKYGEHIGLANGDIKAGEHVHTHNVANHREHLEDLV